MNSSLGSERWNQRTGKFAEICWSTSNDGERFCIGSHHSGRGRRKSFCCCNSWLDSQKIEQEWICSLKRVLANIRNSSRIYFGDGDLRTAQFHNRRKIVANRRLFNSIRNSNQCSHLESWITKLKDLPENFRRLKLDFMLVDDFIGENQTGLLQNSSPSPACTGYAGSGSAISRGQTLDDGSSCNENSRCNDAFRWVYWC